MTPGVFAVFAGAVILWFALSFVTRSWWKQWLAAIIAGLSTAWWRYGAMQAVAASQSIEPMSPYRFGLFAVAGMLVVASLGMGLYRLLQASRRPL